MEVRAVFTFRNRGGDTARGVRVRMHAPGGLMYLVGTARLDGASLEDDAGNTPLLSPAGAAIGDVAPGEERRAEIGFLVAAAIENGTPLSLQAALCADDLAPVGSNIARLTARSRPSLQNGSTVVRLNGTAAPGAQLTVVTEIHNDGASSAHGVTLCAPVPEHTSYVPGSARADGRALGAGFDADAAPVVSRLLAAGATCTVEYAVRIADALPDQTPIDASARVASQEIAPFDLAPARITVESHAHFDDPQTALNLDPRREIVPGSRVSISLRARNAGTAQAHNVTLAVQLPPALHAVRGSTRVDGRPLRERKREPGTIDLGTIAAQDTLDVQTEAIAAAPLADGAELPVKATLRWDGGERTLEATLVARSQPAFPPRKNSITREGERTVAPDARCEAVVQIVNDGSAAAGDVLVHFECDGLDDLSVSEKGANLPIERDAVPLGTIDPFTARTLTLRGRAPSACANGAALRLRAVLHCNQLEAQPLGEAEWRVRSAPLFDARECAIVLDGDRVHRPGDAAVAYVNVCNSGTDAAYETSVRLYPAPELRAEEADGAELRENVLHFGTLEPGARAQARVQLLALAAAPQGRAVTLGGVLTARGSLPLQLDDVRIATHAEPDFSQSLLLVEPDAPVEPGGELHFVLNAANSGDGAAEHVSVGAQPDPALVYIPNSTLVNGLPVRDAESGAPVMDEHGIAFSAVAPGAQAQVEWRESVRPGTLARTAIARRLRIAYGERVDEIAARTIDVRSGAHFADTLEGLPFAVHGLPQPAIVPAQRFIELPPATPVVGREIAAAAMLELPSAFVETTLLLDAERAERVLHFLPEARFGGGLVHVFALRAFAPDTIGAHATEETLRNTLKETLDRLFIKLRLPNYVMAARDLEPAPLRAAFDAALGRIEPGAPVEIGPGVLRGGCDADELRSLHDNLEAAPLGSALPWCVLARLLPADQEARRHYRDLLIERLDAMAELEPQAFLDALQRTRDKVLDAALEIVLAQLGTVRA